MIKMMTEKDAAAVIKENDMSTGFFFAVLAIHALIFVCPFSDKKLGAA